MAGQAVPFRWITGLPEAAQREIERDFTALQLQITQGTSPFDATIDPGLASSDPGSHHYKNLTDLLAHENWTSTLSVGVIQRTGVPIVEPGAMSLGGKGDLALFGTSGFGATGWQWQTLNAVGKTVFYHNLTFAPGAATTLQGGGAVTAVACLFDTNITALVSAVSGSGARAWDCVFTGAISMTSGGGIGLTNKYYNCDFAGTINIGALYSVYIYGGTIGATVTVGNCTACEIYASGLWNLTVATNTGNAMFNNLGGGFQGNVSCTATSGIELNGNWGDVVMSGVPTGQRIFRGSALSIDITGPAQVDALNAAANFGRHVILRGDSLRANFGMFAGRIECIALTNSLIEATFMDTGSGWYTFDNSTHNNVFIFGGTHNANFIPANVSLGTGAFNRVITEDTDSLVSGPPVINPSVIMGELAAVQSGVRRIRGQYGPIGSEKLALLLTADGDGKIISVSSVTISIKEDILPSALLGPQPGMQVIPAVASGAVSTDLWRKDFVLADLVGPQAGVVVTPAPAPGSAPTGPAGGSLNGSYPNPTFAGRDSSVDKINQDLLPAALLPAPPGVTRLINALDATPTENLTISVSYDSYGNVTAVKSTRISVKEDILPAALLGPQPGMQVIPAVVAASTPAVDFNQAFMLMGG